MLTHETQLPNEDTQRFVRILKDAFNLPLHEDISTPRSIWGYLRKVIETGPGKQTVAAPYGDWSVSKSLTHDHNSYRSFALSDGRVRSGP